MVFLVPAAAQVMEADGVQGLVHAQSQRVKSVIVPEGHSLFYLFDADAAHTAHCAGKVSVDHFSAQSDGLEDPGRLIGLEGGNTHLGRNFDNAE